MRRSSNPREQYTAEEERREMRTPTPSADEIRAEFDEEEAERDTVITLGYN
ncbi:hypothetical protein [Actinopolyspora mortivallis]|uniref:hypothetical protein n=1 Tax=Actinopolyspora mortivallis TaxID=33906 RepID=UPI0015E61E0A|nr:hypothetical protein [Actinopolyspora mortivallis]